MVVNAPKITHHVTVGTTIDGAIGAYRSHRGWPHMTCDWTGGRLKIVQHLPLSAAARALRNPGSETNRADTIQIEHVGFPHGSGRHGPPAGFASKGVPNWPAARWEAIADLCRWIERNTGCPRASMPGIRWGEDHPPRLSGAAFRQGRGHHGHQHVPGNDHWDPGGHFMIDLVLEADPSVHRALRQGMSGPDVRALQIAVNARARGCGRPDRVIAVDGEFGPESDRGAAWAAFILGIGESQQELVAGTLSEHVQERVRDPDQRNALQKSRAAVRRRAHCRQPAGVSEPDAHTAADTEDVERPRLSPVQTEPVFLLIGAATLAQALGAVVLLAKRQTLAGVLLSLTAILTGAVAGLTRSQVTPTGRPRDPDGDPLTPLTADDEP